MDMEKIIDVLVKLIEEQENVLFRTPMRKKKVHKKSLQEWKNHLMGGKGR